MGVKAEGVSAARGAAQQQAAAVAAPRQMRKANVVVVVAPALSILNTPMVFNGMVTTSELTLLGNYSQIRSRSCASM